MGDATQFATEKIGRTIWFAMMSRLGLICRIVTRKVCSFWPPSPLAGAEQCKGDGLIWGCQVASGRHHVLTTILIFLVSELQLPVFFGETSTLQLLLVMALRPVPFRR